MKTMVRRKQSVSNSLIESKSVQSFLAGVVNVCVCFLSDENIIIPVTLTEVGSDDKVQVSSLDQSVLLFKNCRIG